MDRVQQTFTSCIGSIGLMVGVTDVTNIINVILLVLSAINILLVLVTRVKKIIEDKGLTIDDKINNIKDAVDDTIEEVEQLRGDENGNK